MENIRKVLDSDEMERVITRIAHEILERNHGSGDVVLIGIRTGGAHIAERIRKKIESIEKKSVPLGLLDITLYRDDLTEIGAQPEIKGTEIPFDMNGKIVILVDDVLFTGRTVRCAIDQLIDFGRPRAIQLAAFVDRGHRELPIKADYVGKNIPTSLDEEVKVYLMEEAGKDEVCLVAKGNK
ncbi:MAG: bifunctional pyr operon transcriptional regulator/uracil phosphoribosyltransferase PyrR [Candidatus Omnitrophica bacterium]|nr:bifunctional pyr operon transcriptional regulator/uracil phosphoribosyltransferase PyrR [Candidatus Omnitrophota bacterium]